jgi:uncharacterized protein
MTDHLLEKFLREYMELFSGQLFFVWLGGEPLLAGLPFFERVLELQAAHLEPGQVVRNAIQTNATLVDDEWAQFFRVNNFRVGVSLDGNRRSHDHFRLNHGGRGSFDEVLRGVEILRRNGVEPGFVQTTTHDTAPNAQEDFEFFSNILKGKRWGVNEFFDVDGINEAMRNQSITNEELTRFLKKYIDAWLVADDGGVQIREIENFMAGVLGKRAASCTFNGACTGYFSLEYDGSVYPCDRLSNRPDLLLGNIADQSLLDVLNGEARLKYAEAVNRLHPDCESCEWLAACHNGCTANRVGGVAGKYHFCETRKATFTYLREKVREHEQQPEDGVEEVVHVKA